MANYIKNPFWSQAQIDRGYNLGGWAEISKTRDNNTSGRNSGVSGEARLLWVHRYLNGELNMSPGEHSHRVDALSGPTNNKVKNGEVTISPVDQALNFRIT